MKAEDLQPNETLKNTKGKSVIPLIRQSHPPKYQSSLRRIHRSGTHYHGHRQRQSLVQSRGGAPTRKDTENQYERRRITDLPRSYVHGSGAFSPDRTLGDQPQTKYHGPARTAARHTLSLSYETSSSLVDRRDSRLHSPCLNSTLAHDAGNSQAAKRRTREWETTVNRSQKKWKTRKPDELKLDLPPECWKNAAGRSHNKNLFLNKHRDGLRENMGAEIVQHQFTDTQLILTYFTPGTLEDDESRPRLPATRAPMTLDRPPSVSDSKVERQEEESSSTFGVVDETSRTSSATEVGRMTFVRAGQVNDHLVVNTPSGSNVKLDDLYRSVTSLINIKEDIHTPLFATKQAPSLRDTYSRLSDDSVNRSVTAPRQMSSRPRHFRSGIAVLRHSPSNSSTRSDTLSEERTSVSPHNVNVRAPPLHTREEAVLSSSRKAETQVTGAALFVPLNGSGNGEHPSEMEQSGSSVPSGFYLEEETSTTVHLPKANGDKQRRILVSDAQDGVYCVTMRGFVHHISLKLGSHRKELYTPPDSDKVFIEDICLFAPPFDNIAVVAQAYEENALSLLHLDDDNNSRVVHVARTSSDLERQRRGVSAVTTLSTSSSSLSFVSAGYDHIVHLWSLDPDPSATFEHPPVAGILDVNHTSLVQSLLSIGNHLISGGADNSVRTWDLQVAQAVSTIRTSNSVYQLHRTENPDVVLTEVGHRDQQFELHDCRLSAEFRPPLRFGYSSTQGANGRYVRGAVDPRTWNTFASCGRDGVIRLWDLRNTRECKQEMMCFPGQKVVHAAFASDKLIVASNDNRLSFFDFARA